MQNIERVFAMIKPDGLRRGLVGEIISRLERNGLKLITCKMTMVTEEQARGNYPGTEEWLINLGTKTYRNFSEDVEQIRSVLGTVDKLEIGKKIYDMLVNLLTQTPVIMMVWEGNHAVAQLRKVVGSTLPMEADMGTIRGDFGFDSPQFAVISGRIVFQNLIHASDSTSESEREIKHWFGDAYSPCDKYTRVDYLGFFSN